MDWGSKFTKRRGSQPAKKRTESRNGDNDRARRLSAREVGSTHRRHGGSNRVGLRDSYPRLERSDFVVIDFSSARKASRAFLALATREYPAARWPPQTHEP